MSKRAAEKAFAKAAIKPSDVQVVELHGNFNNATVNLFLLRFDCEKRKRSTQYDQLSLE